jgi:hypothetical protein
MTTNKKTVLEMNEKKKTGAVKKFNGSEIKSTTPCSYIQDDAPTLDVDNDECNFIKGYN